MDIDELLVKKLSDAKRRAADAQIAFAVAVHDPAPSEKELETLLAQLISTAELARHDDAGIRVAHGHTSFRDRYPAKWSILREDVVRAIENGHDFKAVFRIVEASARVKLPLETAKVTLLLLEREGFA